MCHNTNNVGQFTFSNSVTFVYMNAPILNTTTVANGFYGVRRYIHSPCGRNGFNIYVCVQWHVGFRELSQCVCFRIGYNRSLTTLTNTLFYRFSLVFADSICATVLFGTDESRSRMEKKMRQRFQFSKNCTTQTVVIAVVSVDFFPWT